MHAHSHDQGKPLYCTSHLLSRSSTVVYSSTFVFIYISVRTISFLTYMSYSSIVVFAGCRIQLLVHSSIPQGFLCVDRFPKLIRRWL